MHWIGDAPEGVMKYQARIRYRQPLEHCEVRMVADVARVKFDRPQRAIAPGQFVVFYDGDVCVGGGVIVLPTD
jgi:tRNA-specific 2-thiouridylase